MELFTYQYGVAFFYCALVGITRLSHANTRDQNDPRIDQRGGRVSESDSSTNAFEIVSSKGANLAFLDCGI